MRQLNPCAFSCFSTFHCLYWGFSQQHLFPISPSLTQTQKQWWNQVTKNPMFYYEKLHNQDTYIRTISSLHWERLFTCFIGQTAGMGSNLCGEEMHFSKHCVHYCFALGFFSFTSYMLMVVTVVFSKVEKHVNKVVFVADCWAFCFYCFSLKTKSIACIHEIYTTGLFSFLPYSLTAVFYKCNKQKEKGPVVLEGRGEGREG